MILVHSQNEQRLEASLSECKQHRLLDPNLREILSSETPQYIACHFGPQTFVRGDGTHFSF